MAIRVDHDGNVFVNEANLGAIYDVYFLCDNCGKSRSVIELETLSEDVALCALCLRDLADAIGLYRSPENGAQEAQDDD